MKHWEGFGGLFSKQKLFFKINNKRKIICFQNAEMQYLRADFSELSSPFLIHDFFPITAWAYHSTSVMFLS